jgi:hypothetical protein
VIDLVRFADYDSADGPEATPFLWSPYAPSGNFVSSLIGDGGSGKSFLALTLALHVAAGSPFLGSEVRQGTAVYLDGEMSQAETFRRARAISCGMGLEYLPDAFFYSRVYGSLIDPATFAACRDAIGAKPDTQLVVLDSGTSLAVGLDHNDGREVARFMQSLGELAPTVLLLDHLPKPSAANLGAGMRATGSAAKWNLSRSVMHLAPSRQGHRLLHLKSNFAAQAPPLLLDIEITPERVAYSITQSTTTTSKAPAGKTPKQRVLDALTASEPRTVEQVAQLATMPRKSAANRLAELRTAGRVVSPERGKWMLSA